MMIRLMPQLMLKPEDIRSTFAELLVTEGNRARYFELTNHTNVQDISRDVKRPIPHGYRLLMISTRLGNDKFEIALVCDGLQEVVYYNQVIIVHYVDLKCRPATQQLVWRSTEFTHSAVLQGLASAIFFDYILQRYDVIMSDNTHTGEGQMFWQRRMSEALARNLLVYHYQLMTCRLTQIDDDKHLRALTDTLWGAEDAYKENLAIISCKPLPLDIQISNDN